MKLRLPDVFSKRRVIALEKQVSELTREVTAQKGYMRGYATEYVRFPGVAITRPGARLDYDTLNKCYKQSSAVRPAVDGIVREITTLPFSIEGYPGASFDKAHKKEVEALLNDPNRNKETFRDILAKLLTDVLVYDAGALEKVKSPSGKLVELMARDGSTFVPVGDEHGVLLKYVQTVSGAKAEFEKDELVYMMLYPRAGTLWGQPIIEAIVDEVASLLFSNEQVAKSFTEDEIPPGILNLGEIGKEAYDQAKEDFKFKKGQKKDFQLRVIYGTKDVEWITFKRAAKEMQLNELRQSIERIVFRNFGVVPMELGEVSDINRSTAMFQMRVAQSRLMIPIVNMLTYYINKEIVQDEFGFNDVRFLMHMRVYEDEDPESRAIERLVRTGVKSINQVCAEKGWPPVKAGGDRRFIIVGKRILFIDELDKMKGTEIEGNLEGRDDGGKRKSREDVAKVGLERTAH